MTAREAYAAFWNGFGWKAYEETSVPDNAELPYITFEGNIDFFGSDVASSPSLWDRSSGWRTVTDKEDEISDFIGSGGRMVAFDDGAFWIRRGSPWSQPLSDSSDENIRRRVLNVIVEFIKL